MAKKDSSRKSKSAKLEAAPQSVDLSIGGDMKESVAIVGDNNVVNYYEAVSTNTEKHEPDYWNLKHPYPMPPNFTGRVAERAMLTQWLNDDSENRLFILRALGGFGKSALTWHWLTHDVDIKECPKVVFWSFYEGDTSFENFITETLKYLKLEILQGQRPQVDELLKAMQSQKILIIMDGFERALRAYSSMNAAYQGDEEPKLEDNQLDCVNINAEIFLKSVCSLPNIKSKVLMTTRLTPRAVKPRGEFLQGCREEELTAMQKEDAVEFFRKQGIQGNRAETESACAPYGYHPLSLRILAGLILKDFENPADIAVAQKLKIDGDIKQQQYHVLEVSYNSLLPHEQKLLSTIACFRSAVELKTLKAVVENKKSLNDDLHYLTEYGLLNFDKKNKRFELHPIVRRYSYESLTIAKKTKTHKHLASYFDSINVPKYPETLDELIPIIELYYHTLKTGEYDKAALIYHQFLMSPLFFQFSAYQLEIELVSALFTNNPGKLSKTKLVDFKAWAFSELGSAYSMIGQPRLAIPLFEKSNKIYSRKSKYKPFMITGFMNLATQQITTGKLLAAEKNVRQSIDISLEIESERDRAASSHELARILAYRGIWLDSKQIFIQTQKYFKNIKDIQSFCVGELYRTTLYFLMARSKQFTLQSVRLVIKSAQHVLKLAEGGDPNLKGAIIPRDLLDANWLLGISNLAMGELLSAKKYLNKALSICRSINSVDIEANILLGLASLFYTQGNFSESFLIADEALTITIRCGYVLQGADVNLFLAQYALEQEQDKVKAKEYAESALKLAYCDGPPYYYKVAYDEAERMLEKLK
ncbi:MAG: hypothetical protein H7Y59_09510 [Anaerolineales bacterium]|nr:hypothetical protein [Anaerolineales bacterium]